MGSWTVSDVIVAPRTPTIGFIAQFYGKIQIRWDGSLLAHFTRHALPSFWLVAKYLSQIFHFGVACAQRGLRRATKLVEQIYFLLYFLLKSSFSCNARV
jgi:hypothetical protein